MRLVFGGNRALNYDICLGWRKQRMLTMSQRPNLWKYQCMYWNVFGPFDLVAPRWDPLCAAIPAGTMGPSAVLLTMSHSLCWTPIQASGHLLSFPNLYANLGGFSISFPEPATVSPDIDFNSVLVSIPVSQGRVVVDLRTI